MDDAPRELVLAAAEEGVVALSLNMRGVVLCEGRESADVRVRVLMATLSLWRQPQLLALQEIGGGQESLACLRTLLRRRGYDAAGRPGEEARSRVDGHRRGGVLVAWHRAAFTAARGCAIDGARGAGVACLTQADIDEWRGGQRCSGEVAAALSLYAGRRAIAVHLVRRKGVRANQPILVSSVYVPAQAQPAVRAAFICLVSRRVAALAEQTAMRYISLGDWQAAPSPQWRACGSPNRAHDDALRDIYWGAAPGVGGGSQWQGACMGAAVDATPGCGVYSFHSGVAAVQHRTIDHAFVDLASAADWAVDPRGGVFLGMEGDEWTPQAPFDHRVGLYRCNEGMMAQLGAKREVVSTPRTSGQRRRFQLLASTFAVDCRLSCDEQLAELESFVADATKRARAAAVAEPRPLPVLAFDTPANQLTYLQGLYDLVTASYHGNGSDGKGAAAFFGATHDRRLFRARILRRVRDRELRRGVATEWWQIRDACEHVLRAAITRLQPLVESERLASRRAIDVGVAEPASPQVLAERMRQRQREARGTLAKHRFEVTAMTDPDTGEVEREGEHVLAIMQQYGELQNREGRADEAALAAWLGGMVPRGRPLTMPGGGEWALRRALPEAVFRRETRLQKPRKAAGSHPFMVDMLQSLPESHPLLTAYYELMLRCMAEGVYPAHYLVVPAVLIPKKLDSVLHMALLRDIWLINHGAKLAERCLLHTALAPLGRRALLCHAGGCRGRGCAEHAFALHAAIEDALERRVPIYVLYVDLIKCFMSFSRAAGAAVMRHKGMPEEALRALRGLVDNWKHGVAQGRYESAFGATATFGLLRGFLQGAQASPEACKTMMDTIAQALELKVLGYRAFAPDGTGGTMVQLVFVDDAANVTGSLAMTRRVALFWSIWCRITDCQANIKGTSKTVLTGMELERRRDGELRPRGTKAKVMMGGLEVGDEPRELPVLRIDEAYTYVGYPTRLDGQHNDLGLALVRRKLEYGAAQVAQAPTSRRLATGVMAAYVYGNAFFYGCCFGGSFEQVERALGPSSRRAIRGPSVRGAKRSRRAPRLQLHAAAEAIHAREIPPNDPLQKSIVGMSGEAGWVPGYGSPHPWPAMMAAGAMAFANALATPQWTPAAVQAHHGLARFAWTLGFREKPWRLPLGDIMLELDLTRLIERAVFAVSVLNSHTFALTDCNFPEHSPLHPSRWPGYPPDWVHLWHGDVGERLRRAGVGFSRVLGRAGIAEVANLCEEEGGEFLSFGELVEWCPRVVEHGRAAARAAHSAVVTGLRAAGVKPVPGRRPWAMADAALGVAPDYAPTGFGELRRQRLAAGDAAVCSGDGGRRLAEAVGLQLPHDADEEAGGEDEDGGVAVERLVEDELARAGLDTMEELVADTVARLPAEAPVVKFQLGEAQVEFVMGAAMFGAVARTFPGVCLLARRQLARPRYAAFAAAFWSCGWRAKTIFEQFRRPDGTIPSELQPAVVEAEARGFRWEAWLAQERDHRAQRRGRRREATSEEAPHGAAAKRARGGPRRRDESDEHGASSEVLRLSGEPAFECDSDASEVSSVAEEGRSALPHEAAVGLPAARQRPAPQAGGAEHRAGAGECGHGEAGVGDGASSSPLWAPPCRARRTRGIPMTERLSERTASGAGVGLPAAWPGAASESRRLHGARGISGAYEFRVDPHAPELRPEHLACERGTPALRADVCCRVLRASGSAGVFHLDEH